VVVADASLHIEVGKDDDAGKQLYPGHAFVPSSLKKQPGCVSIDMQLVIFRN